MTSKPTTQGKERYILFYIFIYEFWEYMNITAPEGQFKGDIKGENQNVLALELLGID